MFFAIVLEEDGTHTIYHEVSEWSARDHRDTNLVWIDLEAPDEALVRETAESFRLDPEAVDDCMHGEQRPRVDEYQDNLLFVFYGLLGAAPDSAVACRKLAAFLGRRFLITVHHEPLRTMNDVRDRCTRHPQIFFANGVDGALYRMIDGMVDRYLEVADKYEGRLEALEEASLDPAAGEDTLSESAALRRELLEVRRLAIAQRELLFPLIEGDFDFVADKLGLRFAHVRDHLTEVIDFVDAMRDRLTGVHGNFHLTLAQRTNDVMRFLTIFATIMLPLGLVAGIYGMNVPIWPGGESPYHFWLILGVMVVIAVGLLAFFRRKDWL